MANTHSLDFNRVSTQYAEIGGATAASGGLQPNSDFTIEAWVNIRNAPTSGQAFNVMQKWSGAGVTYQAYGFNYINDGGTLKLNLWVGNGSSTVELKSATLDLGTTDWQYIAVAYDLSAGTAYFYHGDETTSPTQLGSAVTGGKTSIATSTAGSFLMGYFDDGGAADPMDGQMDDLRFWDDLRTSTEISDNYAPEGVDGTEGNSVAVWRCDNSALDETANNNDLTLQNSLTYSTDYPVVSGAVAATNNSARRMHMMMM